MSKEMQSHRQEQQQFANAVFEIMRQLRDMSQWLDRVEHGETAILDMYRRCDIDLEWGIRKTGPMAQWTERSSPEVIQWSEYDRFQRGLVVYPIADKVRSITIPLSLFNETLERIEIGWIDGILPTSIHLSEKQESLNLLGVEK